MSAPTFTSHEIWKNGFYELEVRFTRRDDSLLEAALRACGAFPDITGWYRRKDLEPDQQERIDPTLTDLEDNGHLYGLATVPGFGRLVCGCIAIRLDDPLVDIFDFYIPLAAISKVESRVGGFPFGSDGGPVSLAWRRELDSWMAEVGRFIYRSAPFDHCVIGFEIDEVPGDEYFAHLLPSEDGLRHIEAQR